MANATVGRAGYSEYPGDDAAGWDRGVLAASCCCFLPGAMPGFFTLFSYSILKVICSLLCHLGWMAVSWCHCSILLCFWLKFNHSLCSGLWGWFCFFIEDMLSLSAVQHSAISSPPCQLNKPSTFWIHAQPWCCPLPPQLTSVKKMLRGTCMAMLPGQDTSVPNVTANTTWPALHLPQPISPAGKEMDS